MEEKIELRLPVTAQIVTMKRYLSIGQSRELQKLLLSKSTIDVSTGQVQNANVDMFMAMQDKAAEFLITGIRYEDDQKPTFVFNQDWLYSLPAVDGNIVYAKVDELTKESNLSDADKKKS